MPDSGIRYLAPTAQGTGTGLTVGNAAAAANRLTIEAALRAAAVADPTVAAAGAPPNIAIEMRWRADLGPYPPLAFVPTAAHGGISATRQLRHVSVNGSGVEITHSVTRDHSTLTTTAIGEANVALFVGSRTPDPRAADEKDRIINMGTVLRYATTLDRAHVNVPIAAGVACLPNGSTHDYGTGLLTGGIFEVILGAYDFVQWDGFKWKDYQHVCVPSTGTTGTTLRWTGNFAENIKGFSRNVTAAEFTVEVDGLYVRGFSQSLFRFDYGSGHVFRNLDLDAQLIVGEPIPSLCQFGNGSSGTVGFCTFDNFICRNTWDAPTSTGDYQQGDGFTGNRDSHDETLTNGIFENCGDGGIDDKSYALDPNGYALYVENVDIINARRSVRIHSGNDPAGTVGGIFNPAYLKNVRSIEPWGDAHLQTSGGTLTWENPDVGAAMIDALPRADPQVIRVNALSETFDHVFITLRDLTYDVSPNSIPVDAHDNSSTYPTEAAAEAAATYRIFIQEVSGPGWEGDILVNDEVYDFTTLQVTEGDTTRIEVTDALESALFSVVPSTIGDIVEVDEVTVDVTWRNTDGSLP